MSIQPGVAYGDLHFPGCPFSPGLLTGVKTTRAIAAVVVVEHAYWESALAAVGNFTSGFDTVRCEQHVQVHRIDRLVDGGHAPAAACSARAKKTVSVVL